MVGSRSEPQQSSTRAHILNHKACYLLYLHTKPEGEHINNNLNIREEAFLHVYFYKYFYSVVVGGKLRGREYNFQVIYLLQELNTNKDACFFCNFYAHLCIKEKQNENSVFQRLALIYPILEA